MLCNYECSLPYKLYKKIILRGTLHKYQTKKKINKNKRERERGTSEGIIVEEVVSSRN